MNYHCPKVVLTLLLFPPFLFITASKTYAKEWIVSKDGTGDFVTIQSAINSAVDGDVIKVGAGEYYENVLWEHKDLILDGSGMEETFVLGAVKLKPLLVLDKPRGGGEVFGFTFDCSSFGWPEGLKLEHAVGAFIHDNRFTHCNVGVANYSSSVRLENNLFTFNSAGFLSLQNGTTESDLLNNTFYDNGFGLFLLHLPDRFIRNVVTGSHGAAISKLSGDSESSDIFYNNFGNNGRRMSPKIVIDSTNNFEDPALEDDFKLPEDSSLIDGGGFEDREEDGTRVDLGFEGRAAKEISSLDDFPWLFSKIQLFAEAGEGGLTRSRLFKTLMNKLLAVEDLVLGGEWENASKKIAHDLLPKFVSQNKNSWAEDTPWRRRFHLLLSDLVTLLELE